MSVHIRGVQRKILGSIFFNRRPQTVARELLGKYLVRRFNDGHRMSVIITETEAYDGQHDRACHARSGKTGRNWPMWGPPAHAYVYFTYGMHWMLNLVTREEGYPSAVLIRGAGEFVGPARLTKGLRINNALNAKVLGMASGLWVEDRGVEIRDRHVERTGRIGVDYAGVWAKKPWRFVVKKEANRQPFRPRSRRRSP